MLGLCSIKVWSSFSTSAVMAHVCMDQHWAGSHNYSRKYISNWGNAVLSLTGKFFRGFPSTSMRNSLKNVVEDYCNMKTFVFLIFLTTSMGEICLFSIHLRPTRVVYFCFLFIVLFSKFLWLYHFLFSQLSSIDFAENIDITKIRQLRLDDIRRSYFFASFWTAYCLICVLLLLINF